MMRIWTSFDSISFLFLLLRMKGVQDGGWEAERKRKNDDEARERPRPSAKALPFFLLYSDLTESVLFDTFIHT